MEEVDVATAQGETETLRSELERAEDLAGLRRLWDEARRHLDACAGPDRLPELQRLYQRQAALPTLRGILAVNQRELARVEASIGRITQDLTRAREELERLARPRFLRRPDQQAAADARHRSHALQRHLGRLQDERADRADKVEVSRRALRQAEAATARIPELEAAVSRRRHWLRSHPAEVAWEADLAVRVAQRSSELEASRTGQERGAPDDDLEPALLEWVRKLDLSAHRPRAGIGRRRTGRALGLPRHPSEAEIFLPPLPGRGIEGPDLGR